MLLFLFQPITNTTTTTTTTTTTPDYYSRLLLPTTTTPTATTTTTTIPANYYYYYYCCYYYYYDYYYYYYYYYAAHYTTLITPHCTTLQLQLQLQQQQLQQQQEREQQGQQQPQRQQQRQRQTTTTTTLHDTRPITLSSTTTTATTTLLYTTLPYTAMHNTTVHYITTTTRTALHHTTLQHTTYSSWGWGDHCNHYNHSKKHNSNHLSDHQWIRDSQQLTSPIVSYLWNFCHALWGTIGKIIFEYIVTNSQSNREVSRPIWNTNAYTSTIRLQITKSNSSLAIAIIKRIKQSKYCQLTMIFKHSYYIILYINWICRSNLPIVSLFFCIKINNTLLHVKTTCKK